MASNVFGNPITNITLLGLGYSGDELTRLNRARVAYNQKNAGDKDFNVRKYVENLKAQWGTGVSTMCVIYNATGGPISLVNRYNWYGRLGPAPYPTTIQNGQWGGFLHVKTSGAATGSSGAVVYRGQNSDGKVCEWMVSWSNPWNRASWDNTAYTEIREEKYFDNADWRSISRKLYDSGLSSSATWNGCVSQVSTGSGTTVVFEAIITLVDADRIVPPKQS